MTVLRRFSFYPAIAGTGAVVLLAVPLVGSLLGGTGEVAASTGRTLPAYVVATAANNPHVGTLVITPQPEGGIAAVVVRGQGLTLDQSSTLINTSVGTGEGQQQLALLAGDLSSTGGAQAEPQLRQWGIGYILLAPSATGDASRTTAEAATASSRVRSSLDANPTLTPIGETDVGLLWSYPDVTTVDVESATPASATQPWRTIILAAQSLVIILTLLVAIPTGPPRVEGRRREDPVEDDVDDEPIDLLGGDDDEA
jgi:hypothetical protein